MSQPINVVVTGGRDFNDAAFVNRVLDDIRPFRIFHGACGVDADKQDWRKLKGADKLANDWAISRGVFVLGVPAAWSRLGLRAGPVRNKRLITDYLPNLVIAFPGGNGTRNLISHAEHYGTRIIAYNEHLIRIENRL